MKWITKKKLFKNLTKLKKLNLESNQINEIDSNGFKGLRNFEVLYLRDNEFTEIEPKCPENMKKLIKWNKFILNYSNFE